eukprot:jgi/Botrbrau1/3843/Bobra.0183s0068.1
MQPSVPVSPSGSGTTATGADLEQCLSAAGLELPYLQYAASNSWSLPTYCPLPPPLPLLEPTPRYSSPDLFRPFLRENQHFLYSITWSGSLPGPGGRPPVHAERTAHYAVPHPPPPGEQLVQDASIGSAPLPGPGGPPPVRAEHTAQYAVLHPPRPSQHEDQHFQDATIWSGSLPRPGVRPPARAERTAQYAVPHPPRPSQNEEQLRQDAAIGLAPLPGPGGPPPALAQRAGQYIVPHSCMPSQGRPYADDTNAVWCGGAQQLMTPSLAPEPDGSAISGNAPFLDGGPGYPRGEDPNQATLDGLVCYVDALRSRTTQECSLPPVEALRVPSAGTGRAAHGSMPEQATLPQRCGWIESSPLQQGPAGILSPLRPLSRGPSRLEPGVPGERLFNCWTPDFAPTGAPTGDPVPVSTMSCFGSPGGASVPRGPQMGHPSSLTPDFLEELLSPFVPPHSPLADENPPPGASLGTLPGGLLPGGPARARSPARALSPAREWSPMMLAFSPPWPHAPAEARTGGVPAAGNNPTPVDGACFGPLGTPPGTPSPLRFDWLEMPVGTTPYRSDVPPWTPCSAGGVGGWGGAAGDASSLSNGDSVQGLWAAPDMDSETLPLVFDAVFERSWAGFLGEGGEAAGSQAEGTAGAVSVPLGPPVGERVPAGVPEEMDAVTPRQGTKRNAAQVENVGSAPPGAPETPKKKKRAEKRAHVMRECKLSLAVYGEGTSSAGAATFTPLSLFAGRSWGGASMYPANGTAPFWTQCLGRCSL